MDSSPTTPSSGKNGGGDSSATTRSAWSDNDFIGARGRTIVTRVAQHDGDVAVTADWVSNHCTGPSRLTFRLDGDLVREIRITGEERPPRARAVYGRASNETTPVGSHPAGATPQGIHDLAGNVAEWTSPLYRAYPHDRGDGRERSTAGGERVTRGGDHVYTAPDDLRSSFGTGFSRATEFGHRHIGFRCALPTR